MDNATANSSNVTAIAYCNLGQFSNSYREVHGYVSILVCVLGSIANVLNISILTTKEMRWPTNFILTGLAIADLMVMLEYIPYAIHVYFNPLSRKSANYFTYPAAVFMFFHAVFTQVCHFISCCLTLILAMWRYIAITYIQKNRIWCSPERTMWAIALTYVICPIMCFPIYLSLRITTVNRTIYINETMVDKNMQNATGETENTTSRIIYFLGYTDQMTYKTMSFWVYGVVLKLTPCIILTIFSHQLIKALIAAKKRRYNLLRNKGIPLDNLNGKANATTQGFLEKEQQTDRTTMMLLAVLLLFLITEFPQAILGLLSGSMGDEFDKQCHRPLGDLLDIFALTNSAINFILYCSMSSQFRKAFRKLFHTRIPYPRRKRQKQKTHEEVDTIVTEV